MSKIKSATDTEYWKDANTFLNSMLPDNAEELIQQYMVDNKLTHDEARYFLYNLEDAFKFKCTISLLKTSI